MNLDPFLIVSVTIAIFLGGIIQGAIGFAYSLFVTPIMVWLGVPLQETIVIVSTCSSAQSWMALRRLKNFVPWKEAWISSLGRLPTMVIGVLLLHTLAFLDAGTVKLVVGCIICFVVTVQVSFKVKPAEKVHPAWSFLAFSASGLLTGLSGMGGPPLVMWVMAHNWINEKTRAFLFATFAMTFPVQMGLIAWAFGAAVLKGILIGLLLTPVVYLGSRVGIPLGSRMAKPMLRNVAYVTLILIALSAILPQAFRLLAP